MERKRGQISTEYLILVGFIVFIVISMVGFATLYSSSAREKIRFSNLASFANAIISNAEDVYYAGEPSKVTIEPYMPSGIQSVTILNNEIVFYVSASGGLNIVSYTSKVPLSGTLSPGEGLKRVQIIARTSYSEIVEG